MDGGMKHVWNKLKENLYKILDESVKERDNLEDLGINRRIILKAKVKSRA